MVRLSFNIHSVVSVKTKTYSITNYMMIFFPCIFYSLHTVTSKKRDDLIINTIELLYNAAAIWGLRRVFFRCLSVSSIVWICSKLSTTSPVNKNVKTENCITYQVKQNSTQTYSTKEINKIHEEQLKSKTNKMGIFANFKRCNCHIML